MFKVVLFDFGFIRPDKDVYSRLCVCLQVYRTEHVVVVNSEVYSYAVAIRTGTVRRVWFAIRIAMGIFLAIVGEIFVFFDFYNLTLINQQ